jgi:hypothetical protein
MFENVLKINVEFIDDGLKLLEKAFYKTDNNIETQWGKKATFDEFKKLSENELNNKIECEITNFVNKSKNKMPM